MLITNPTLIFDFVWTYTVKELDGCKKTRATLDGSPCHGKTRILDHTYANCPDHTGERIFYATSAVEDLVTGGADASQMPLEKHLDLNSQLISVQTLRSELGGKARVEGSYFYFPVSSECSDR